MGRVGGAQRVQLETACADVGGIAHELLHAAGFEHEQSRGDRDLYITIMWEDIAPQFRFAFEKRGEGAQDVGPYDYGSIMHYGAYSFSQTGRPTIVPRTPHAPIGNREKLSEGEKQAITALYGHGAPSIPGLPSLPSAWPPSLPALLSWPGLPSSPPATPSACATGQTRDLVSQSCVAPCASGAPPVGGFCAPSTLPATPFGPGY
jgi:Astacin (Peptidase family M12A)